MNKLKDFFNKLFKPKNNEITNKILDYFNNDEIKPLTDHIYCPNCSYPIYRKDFDEVPDEVTALLNGET